MPRQTDALHKIVFSGARCVSRRTFEGTTDDHIIQQIGTRQRQKLTLGELRDAGVEIPRERVVAQGWLASDGVYVDVYRETILCRTVNTYS